MSKKEEIIIVGFLVKNGIAENEIIFPLGGGGSCHATTQSLRIATKEEENTLITKVNTSLQVKLNKQYQLKFEPTKSNLTEKSAMRLIQLLELYENDDENSISILPMVSFSKDSLEQEKSSKLNWDRTNWVVTKLVKFGVKRNKISFLTCGASDYLIISIVNYDKLEPPFPNLKR